MLSYICLIYVNFGHSYTLNNIWWSAMKDLVQTLCVVRWQRSVPFYELLFWVATLSQSHKLRLWGCIHMEEKLQMAHLYSVQINGHSHVTSHLSSYMQTEPPNYPERSQCASQVSVIFCRVLATHKLTAANQTVYMWSEQRVLLCPEVAFSHLKHSKLSASHHPCECSLSRHVDTHCKGMCHCCYQQEASFRQWHAATTVG